MKLKYKLTLAALAFAAAGQANASIADFNTGNGELFFSLWDPVNQVSYTRDLGISMNDFLSGTAGTSPSAYVHTNTGVNAAGFSLNFASDANLQNFMATATASNLIWNIGAGDLTGGNGYNAQRYLTTTKASLSTVKTQTNTNLTKFSGANLYVDQVDLIQGGTAADNFSSTAAGTSNPAYTGGVNGYGVTWGGKSVFNTTASIGQSMYFYFMTPSSTSTTAKAFVDQYGNQNGVSTWSFDGQKLAFNAPVPEADTWAMLGLGLVGVGAIARRKTKKFAAK
jgi:hypothetical protein